MLSTCCLRNALHATTAYTFLSISTFKSALNLRCFYPFLLPNALRATMARNFSCQTDGSAPAALASLLFDPSEPQNIGKTQRFVTCLESTFLRICIFFLLTLSLLWSSFFVLLFSDSSHLHTVAGLTAKLPSLMQAPLTGFHQNLRKIFSQGPLQDLVPDLHYLRTCKTATRKSCKIFKEGLPEKSQDLLTRISWESA